MTEQLGSMIQARSAAITSKLEDIVGKIDQLEAKFDVEMAKIPVDIERRGQELTKMLVSRACLFVCTFVSRRSWCVCCCAFVFTHEIDSNGLFSFPLPFIVCRACRGFVSTDEMYHGYTGHCNTRVSFFSTL